MNNVLVSIIIPVYNVEVYLRKCLEAAVNQTYDNLEIIIVNDGTRDNSVKICYEFAEKDKRIKIVNKKNGGLSSARNAGLDCANGRYCFFYDSDDYIETDTIQDMVLAMEKYDANLVAANVDLVDESGKVQLTRWQKNNIYTIVNEKERFSFFSKVYYNYEISFEVWNKLYDMEIIRKYNIRFENNYKVFAEDICFLSYYLQHVNKVVSLKKVYYHYLIRENSIMGQNKKMTKFKEFVYLTSLVYKYIDKIGANGEMKDKFFMLFGQLMHDRYHWFRYYDLPSKIRKEDFSGLELFYSQARKYIIEHKADIKKYYNEIEPKENFLGNCILEETYIAEYAKSNVKTFFYIIKVSLARALRKLHKIYLVHDKNVLNKIY